MQTRNKSSQLTECCKFTNVVWGSEIINCIQDGTWITPVFLPIFLNVGSLCWDIKCANEKMEFPSHQSSILRHFVNTLCISSTKLCCLSNVLKTYFLCTHFDDRRRGSFEASKNNLSRKCRCFLNLLFILFLRGRCLITRRRRQTHILARKCERFNANINQFLFAFVLLLTSMIHEYWKIDYVNTTTSQRITSFSRFQLKCQNICDSIRNGPLSTNKF